MSSGSSTIQGPLWGHQPDVWSRTFEEFTRPLYERGLDEAEVGAGTHLLDAGCGAGLAVTLACERSADVAGLDASEGLLGVARRRAPGADLRQGDLEELPFDDGTFNAVTAFNSVQYAADPIVALREIRRVAIADAPIVLATWATADRCESRVVFAALGGLLPPPPPGAGGPFALSAPGQLEALVEQAGIRPQRAGVVDVEFTFASVDDAVEAHLSAGPGRRTIEHAGLDATVAALRTALEEDVRPDGSSVHRNGFRYLVAAA